jgi:hypothetical protein
MVSNEGPMGMEEATDPMDDRYAKIEWLMRTHGLGRDEATEACDYDTDPATWAGSRWEDEYSDNNNSEAVDETNEVEFEGFEQVDSQPCNECGLYESDCNCGSGMGAISELARLAGTESKVAESAIKSNKPTLTESDDLSLLKRLLNY